MRLVYRFQGQKVKDQGHQAIRPINGTHIVQDLPNGKSYEHHTWCTDGGRGSASAIGAMTSKVKGQDPKVTWSVWAVLAQCCTCVIRSRRGIPCRSNQAATLLVIIIILISCRAYTACTSAIVIRVGISSVCLSVRLSVMRHTLRSVYTRWLYTNDFCQKIAQLFLSIVDIVFFAILGELY